MSQPGNRAHEVWLPVVPEALSSASGIYTIPQFGRLIYWVPSVWNSGCLFYLEAVMRTDTVSTTAYLQLWDGAAQVVEISTNSTDTSNPTRVRSGAVTMPATAKTIQPKVKNAGGGTTWIYQAWLIVKVPA